MAVPDRKEYWFPAKRYGWGWGPPITWQGRIVVAVWAAALVVGAVVLLPERHGAFAGFILAMGGLLTLVCYLTGEPPAWRWGDRDLDV